MKRYLLSFFIAVSLVSCSSKQEENDNSGGNGNTNPVAKKDCTLPWGGIVNHGIVVKAYKDSESSSCQEESRTCNDGTLSGSFSHVSCTTITGGSEGNGGPVAGEEAPLHINSNGQKIGSLKLVSDKSIWTLDQWHGNPEACPSSAVMGGSCSTSGPQSCRLPDGQKVICQTKRMYKLWGWINEKDGPKYTPLEGVKVDIFWFAGCLAGMCGSFVPPVYTNANGYFEIFTPELLDTLRIVGRDGYYGLCDRTKPIQGGGEAVNIKKVGDPMGPYVQYKLTDDSCKFGSP